jgi:two-component system nitrogen regulation response regulator NtrX
MNVKHKILIIDDEAPIRQTLAACLMDEGYEVFSAKDGESGLEALKSFQPEIILLDIWMPGKLDGLMVLSEGRKVYPQGDFVMMSGHGTIETAVKATKLGAWDFIEKPLSTDKIIVTLQNLTSFRQEREDKATLLNKLRRNIAIIGESSPMRDIKQALSVIAAEDSLVFIEGQTGTGKALVAQNIHYLSNRAGHPYIDISCKTIPATLIESELFGFEKGAFPGADKARRGKFELAHTGTIFIDDIQDMPLEIQDKLLAFLNNGYFMRVGGHEKIEVKTRIITASCANMAKEISEGRFREVLLQKLKTHLLKLPPLKERFGDIPALISHFSDMMVREGAFERKTFSAKAYEKMQEYAWPGHVRELKNFIERIYILTPSEFVDVHDLNFAGLVVGDAQADNLQQFTSFNTFRDARAKFEKEFLLLKLNENNGNITKTAEVIGLERSYLHRKIKSYGINVDN